MTEEKNNKKNYPKSINNLQCLGPCYEKNTSILHPTRFRTVTSIDSAFCPTTEHDGEDPITHESIKLYTDKCLNPTHVKDELSSASILAPRSEFSKELFLAVYYEINSFEECIEWLDNNSHLPLKTQIRVVNAVLSVFGDNLQLIDDKFVKFFISYIKSYEIQGIYDKVYKYIGISKDSVLIVDERSNKLDKKDMQIERMNYIVSKFLNEDSIKNFLLKYTQSFSDWKIINDNLYNMSLTLTEYIIKKVKLQTE
jgi:hypothetical protein